MIDETSVAIAERGGRIAYASAEKLAVALGITGEAQQATPI